MGNILKFIDVLKKIIISIIAVLGIVTVGYYAYTYIYGTPVVFTRSSEKSQGTADPNKSLEDYYNESQTVTEQKPNTNNLTFLAVGDISLSRNIAQTIKVKNDVLYPFRGVDQLLKSTDFNFGNLETPFSNSDTFTAHNTLVFNAPKANVVGLKTYNFSVLNLANNHALDQGVTGITTTAKVLDDNGILHMGTGPTLDDAWKPAIMEKNGLKIAFIGASYASSNDGGKTTNNYVARIEDTKRLQTTIYKLKTNVDVIVVTMHAGTEYTPTANPAQIAFAHTAIDAGADIVIGAHPHWVQNKEQYCPKDITPSPSEGRAGDRLLTDNNSNCKWIYYSLGNFMFDQNWSKETQQGLALKITVSKPSQCHSGLRAGIQNQELDTESEPGMTQDVCNNPFQGSNITPTISIEEIPISIKENCCPTIKDK